MLQTHLIYEHQVVWQKKKVSLGAFWHAGLTTTVGLSAMVKKFNIVASALFDAFFGKIGVSFCFLVIGRLGKIGAIFCFFVTVEICESAEDFCLCLCE